MWFLFTDDPSSEDPFTYEAVGESPKQITMKLILQKERKHKIGRKTLTQNIQYKNSLRKILINSKLARQTKMISTGCNYQYRLVFRICTIVALRRFNIFFSNFFIIFL